MTSYPLILLGVGAANLLAAASPGPAFLLVSRAAIAQGRQIGIATGLGVAAASLSWACAASLGLGFILTQFAWLYTAVKLAGGLYLCWIGFQAIRHATAPISGTGPDVATPTTLRAWRGGYAAGLTNPKVIVFFGSIFVTLFAADTPLWVRLAALGVVALNETLWYSLVALLFSTGGPRRAYARAKAWIDRVAGAVMLGFGCKLILGARS